jgi:uncharacterized membrane protein
MSGLVADTPGSPLFIPLLFVVGGGVVARALATLNRSLHESGMTHPYVVTATVRSAQEVRGTVVPASGTVTGVALSVSLVVIEQTSAPICLRHPEPFSSDH